MCTQHVVVYSRVRSIGQNSSDCVLRRPLPSDDAARVANEPTLFEQSLPKTFVPNPVAWSLCACDRPAASGAPGSGDRYCTQSLRP